MRISTPESRLATLMLLLLLTVLIAGSAAGSEAVRKPRASGVVASQDVVVVADAIAEMRDTVRREVRVSVRGHALRDGLRAALREHASAVREIREVRIDLDEVWRELGDGCRLRSANAHRDSSLGWAAHTLASMAKELTPKLGVLIGTGAKLLGRFLQAV